MQATDTIVALSTPPGRGGIGVIRISGQHALPLARRLLRDESFAPEPNRVALRNIYDEGSEAQVIDRALVTYFKAPHSFTGEDVLELSCHGSPTLLLHILDRLLNEGARAADPGEFTLRALSNGRLNLSQAEAIRDLIDAQTYAAVRQAARQLGGELSARLKPVKSALLEIIVPLESSLEFVEDDLPEDVTRQVGEKLSELARRVDTLAQTFRAGRLLKEGLKVTLAGRPNVGKSSVFNRLLAADRAIVTDVPGTTRDSLSEVLSLDGVPVLLTDTAGVRASGDQIEQLGIERTRRAIVDADLVVVILDGSQPLTKEDEEVLDQTAASRHLIALNKSDLATFDLAHVSARTNGSPLVPVSAKTGAGLERLCAAIMEPFVNRETHETGFLITNARHFDLLRRTAEALRRSEDLVRQRASEELLLVGLYDALRFLGEITGETTPDDVLTQIFSTFCIGK
ncbi:MAG TPA: tRNA uridine-5-carboxymethylaminomethyl(34) synthesis GTPase MnmE [Pyrinomonadaceae bacterium]|nr:tRNA uridine-5-carboxymethylaminomethyl(34) synthesis GTPase MnmE [Pyrinomonadaceae bacterium]